MTRCCKCSVLLTRENTGGYRAGVPDICKRCEEETLYEAFKRFGKYEDFYEEVVQVEHTYDIQLSELVDDLAYIIGGFMGRCGSRDTSVREARAFSKGNGLWITLSDGTKARIDVSIAEEAEATDGGKSA